MDTNESEIVIEDGVDLDDRISIFNADGIQVSDKS
jgi:hypothetical protein